MRIATPACLGKKWFVHIFFREIGHPFPVRIGKSLVNVGKGREHYGKLARVTIEVEADQSDIELFAGSRIISVVASLTPTVPDQYYRSLSPRDEVELANPNDIITVDDAALMRDVSKGRSDQLFQQLEVQEKKRRRMLTS